MILMSKCNERRDIILPNCKEIDPIDCNRTYHIYFPSILCDGDDDGSNINSTKLNEEDEEEEETNNNYNTGILPLVFGIHCYGCTAINLSIFIDRADSHNVILVLPEGIRSSFNAVECCGYAKTQNIDDVGFFAYIQRTLSLEYPSIIQSRYTYAVGWSNGGFMVMAASSLFRAIAPIAGYISVADMLLPDYYRTNNNNNNNGVKLSPTSTSEGKPTNNSSNSNGKGLFLHHGANDPVVRPTGCCHDPTLPQCCCDIAAETCVSVMDVAQNWASMINGCRVDENVPSLVLTSITNNKAKDTNMIVDDDDDDDDGRVGIECYTAMGVECLSNTTICMHNTAGHFNAPSFNDAFPMANEVMDFFARDACEVYHGRWNGAIATQTGGRGGCVCPANRRGMFCLDDASSTAGGNETTATKTISSSLTDKAGEEGMNVEHYGSLILLVIGGSVLFVYLYGRNHTRSPKKRKRSSMTIDTVEEEEMELVRSSSSNTTTRWNVQ